MFLTVIVVTVVVQAAGFCKRPPASLNRAKQYLKKVKLYKKQQVDHLTQDNVIEEFTKLDKARTAKIVEKMKAENLLSRPLKRKSQAKPLPRKKVKIEEDIEPKNNRTESLFVKKDVDT